MRIHKGDKVVWKWTQGGVPRTTSRRRTAVPARRPHKKGATYSKTFSKKGTFKYVCTIHSSMKVTVKVS